MEYTVDELCHFMAEEAVTSAQWVVNDGCLALFWETNVILLANRIIALRSIPKLEDQDYNPEDVRE